MDLHDFPLVAVVLSIAADRLASMTLADPHGLHVGDPLYAIGHGLGMVGPTLMEGVVGSVPVSEGGAFTADTPVLAGFAGAPVLDAHGSVIGVVGSGRSARTTRITAADDVAALLDGLHREAGEPAGRKLGREIGAAPGEGHVERCGCVPEFAETRSYIEKVNQRASRYRQRVRSSYAAAIRMRSEIPQ